MTSASFNETLHDQLYYSIKSIFQRWTALQLAVKGEWGGSDSSLKMEWFSETLADYMYDFGSKVDEEDIEDVLLQIMSDEFMTQLDDGSEITIAKKLLSLYKELVVGNLNLYQSLQNTSPSINIDKNHPSHNVSLENCIPKSAIVSESGQLIETNDSDDNDDSSDRDDSTMN